jgi:probable F420-dependent oxidoreductase
LAHPEALRTLAAHAERLGYSSVWVADHVALPLEVSSRYPYSADGEVPWESGEQWLSPLITLAWLSGTTRGIDLGVSILVLPLRNPLLVAKDAATVDRLSDGRLILGIGSGWLREEFDLLGRPFDDRFGRTKEAIEILKTCWNEEPVVYAGRYERLEPFSMLPKPNGVPVWGGGKSERALRLVADVCDGWHPSNLLPDEWADCADRLRRLVDKAGRAVEAVTLTARPGRRNRLDASLLEAYERVGVEVVVADVEYRSGRSLEDAVRDMERIACELSLS